MDKERIRDEAEAFFEWPTHDKTHVTTTSMLIFAGVIAGMAAEEAVRAEKAWRKDAEAVLEKMAGEGWITEALQAEGVSGIGKALLSLKREARGVLSPPNTTILDNNGLDYDPWCLRAVDGHARDEIAAGRDPYPAAGGVLA